MTWLKDNWLFLLSLGIVIVAVVVVCVVAHFQKKRYGSSKATTRDLTFGAICVASAFALSFFGYSLPQGGTITPASVLPIMLYCHYRGIGRGAIVCLSFTLLQFMQDPYILTPFQVLLDYFFPYLALIFSAVIPFNRKKYNLLSSEDKSLISCHGGFFIGGALYAIFRYTSHVLSGAIFFGEYAPVGWGAWPYSFAYNSFALVDAIIAVGVGAALFTNKAFNAFMAKSFNAVQKSDSTTKNDQRTTA